MQNLARGNGWLCLMDRLNDVLRHQPAQPAGLLGSSKTRIEYDRRRHTVHVADPLITATVHPA